MTKIEELRAVMDKAAGACAKSHDALDSAKIALKKNEHAYKKAEAAWSKELGGSQ